MTNKTDTEKSLAQIRSLGDEFQKHLDIFVRSPSFNPDPKMAIMDREKLGKQTDRIEAMLHRALIRHFDSATGLANTFKFLNDLMPENNHVVLTAPHGLRHALLDKSQYKPEAPDMPFSYHSENLRSYRIVPNHNPYRLQAETPLVIIDQTSSGYHVCLSRVPLDEGKLAQTKLFEYLAAQIHRQEGWPADAPITFYEHNAPETRHLDSEFFALVQMERNSNSQYRNPYWLQDTKGLPAGIDKCLLETQMQSPPDFDLPAVQASEKPKQHLIFFELRKKMLEDHVRQYPQPSAAPDQSPGVEL